MGMPEGEETEQRIENLCEKIMTENFLVKEVDTQVQEAQRVPKRNLQCCTVVSNIFYYTPQLRKKFEHIHPILQMCISLLINYKQVLLY